MRLSLIALFVSFTSLAQSSPESAGWIDRLNLAGALPEKLLSTRTAAFYDYRLSAQEIEALQQYFQRTGIDAVAYFELDMLMAGKDVTNAFSAYLTRREIQNLVFVEKEKNYRITITLFNGKENVVDAQQNAWSISNPVFTEALKTLYRTAANQLKRTNLLINELPETDITINPILGKRNEFFAIDLKVDPLAVPRTGDENIDKKLERIFQEHYPLKYKLTDPGVPEKELRKQGLLYVMCVVHTRSVVAKRVLGYDMTKAESAQVSVTYSEGQSQLKNIPSNTDVYKVYFKHIDSGNVFLGTKWDADLTLEQAIINQLRGLKVELRLN
ncbi:MAG TPA: hypothetical protein VD816_00575 [Ohtaekwangia sp.]|nr:hypothetical protein [Ohtaekwangia sp.]